MKKIISYTLIALTIGQIFAPFGFSLNKGNFTNLKAEAADCSFESVSYSPATTYTSNGEFGPRPEQTTLTIKTVNCEGKLFNGYIRKDAIMGGIPLLKFDLQEIQSDTFSFVIKTGEEGCGSSNCETILDLYLQETGDTHLNELDHFTSEENDNGKDFLDFTCNNSECSDSIKWGITSTQGLFQSTNWTIVPTVTSTSITVSGIGPLQGYTSTTGNQFSNEDTLTVGLYDGNSSTLVAEKTYNIKSELTHSGEISYSTTFSDLTSATGYDIKLKTRLGEQAMNGIYTLTDDGQTVSPLPQDDSNRGDLQNNNGELPVVCRPLTGQIVGCIAKTIYYLLFEPSSFIFGLSGKILDFSVMYSIDNNSYESNFVVEGWGLVRDFCNMFFIFILLYIAFSTILNVGGAKTKDLIINVILIGLFINFSLFTTQVIIDASNILTRVFYNQNTIVTGTPTKDATGKIIKVESELGDFGEIKLSEAIVSKVDPQKLILRASDVDDIHIRSSVYQESNSGGTPSAGTFILVTLLATAVNVIGIIAFLSSALIFIARVIGLWLAMILAPFAFFSYIVPGMKSFKMIGWSHWWPETLKLAFLGPVFVFFMYLIVGFLDKGLGILNSTVSKEATGKGLGFVLSIVVPFIFICILLIKAKNIAKDMSGEIGQTVSKLGQKAGGVVGGLALGAATGGLAMLGRQTIGRAATNLSQSNGFRDWAAKSGGFGKTMAKMTGGIASASFDARGVKIAGKSLGSTGLKVGKNVKTGGFAKSRDEKIKKEEEFANKMLDTTDSGFEKIKRGGSLSAETADKVIQQMIKGGGDFGKDKNGNPLNSAAYKAKLMGGKELDTETARQIADNLNAIRRSDRADHLSSSMFMTNKIAANKIRKQAKDFKKTRENSFLLAELKKQMENGGKKEDKTGPSTPPSPKK